jgi:CRP/FNR family transcriptional regulator, transcriptional activator FtrB
MKSAAIVTSEEVMAIDPELLRDVPVFADLDNEALVAIAAVCSRTEKAAQSDLFRSGDPVKYLYIVLSGQVGLGTASRGKEFALIELVRPVDCFVLPTVLLERPHLMTAKVLEDADLLCVEAASLREMVKARPLFAYSMLASLSCQYRAMIRQVSDLKLRSAAQRLGCYLLTLALEQGGSSSRNGGAQIRLPVEKRLLASRLGTTPEHLSRAFGVLRSRGVSTRGRDVVITDRSLLARFARPDPIE